MAHGGLIHASKPYARKRSILTGTVAVLFLRVEDVNRFGGGGGGVEGLSFGGLGFGGLPV